MPKRKTTAEDAPVKDHKMRDDDESSSDVRLDNPKTPNLRPDN